MKRILRKWRATVNSFESGDEKATEGKQTPEP